MKGESDSKRTIAHIFVVYGYHLIKVRHENRTNTNAHMDSNTRKFNGHDVLQYSEL